MSSATGPTTGNLEPRTHYNNLQVAENASQEVIKGAYKYLAQKWHPDRNPDNYAKAAHVTSLINEAYRVLSDSALRKEHDQWIRSEREKIRSSSQSHRSQGFTPDSSANTQEPRPQYIGMVYCRGCGKEIHETAMKCPKCNYLQKTASAGKESGASDGPLWVPITSLVLGVIAALSLFDESQWDGQTIFGMVNLSAVGFVFGVMSIKNQKNGKNMAITGVVLSSLAFLVFILMLLN